MYRIKYDTKEDANTKNKVRVFNKVKDTGTLVDRGFSYDF